MSFVGKWFGFGRNPQYDEGVRAYERGDDPAAIELFRTCLLDDPEPGTRERAKNYLAGSLGRRALAEMDEGRLESAIELLSEATHLRPHFADLRRKHALALLLNGDHAQSLSEVNAALSLNPNYGHALALLAALTLHSGDAATAKELARKAATADPRLPGSALEKLEAALAEGKSEHGVALLTEWTPDPSASIDETMAQADAHMKKMRWRQAEQLYRQALEKQPRYADLRLKHGQSLLELDELADAASEFREALTLNPHLAEAYALLGVALRRQGDETGSKTSFLAAVEIDPNQPIAAAELHRLRG